MQLHPLPHCSYKQVDARNGPLMVRKKLKKILRGQKISDNNPTQVLYGLVPLINMQKLRFEAFCEIYRSHIPQIWYDKICKSIQCACADLVLLNGEMATVSTCFRKLKFSILLSFA